MFLGGVANESCNSKSLSANVSSEGRTLGAIGRGFLVLLGVADNDTDSDLDYMLRKITGMRIFEDEQGKMNLSLKDVDGELFGCFAIHIICQYKKRQPTEFYRSRKTYFSKKMYLEFIKRCKDMGFKTEEGEFGADMQVSLVNDGPVTIIMDSTQR